MLKLKVGSASYILAGLSLMALTACSGGGGGNGGGNGDITAPIISGAPKLSNVAVKTATLTATTAEITFDLADSDIPADDADPTRSLTLALPAGLPPLP